MAKLGIVKRVGTSHPGGFVRLRKILRQICPRHQMKAKNLHKDPNPQLEPFGRLERFELSESFRASSPLSSVPLPRPLRGSNQKPPESPPCVPFFSLRARGRSLFACCLARTRRR